VSASTSVRDDAGTAVSAVALEAHNAAATPEGLLRDTAPPLSAAAVRPRQKTPRRSADKEMRRPDPAVESGACSTMRS
jgi:hypothetical protein